MDLCQCYNQVLPVLLSSSVSEGQWAVAYNGSERRWLVDESMTHPGVQYVFRVAAYNAKGWGPFSFNSTVFLSPPGMGVCVLCVCVCMCVCACVPYFQDFKVLLSIRRTPQFLKRIKKKS